MTGRTGAVVALLVATLLVATLVVVTATPAHATIFLNASASLPNTVVGQSATGTLTIQNFTTPPESTLFPSLRASAIDLYPSCTAPNTDCVGGTVEPGVYQLGATGTGSGPATCAGPWAITQVGPGRWRFVPPGGEASLQLATNASCVVTFSFTTLRVPPTDTQPELNGIQTAAVTGLTPLGQGQDPFARQGTADVNTVDRAIPGLTTLASATGSQLGSSTLDTATLEPPPPPSSANGAPPTGTMTYNVFGPGNDTCTGTPVFTTTVAVNGFFRYNSSFFTPTQAGTYRWVVRYSGDASYQPAGPTACLDPLEAVTFTRAAPTIVTNATPAARVGTTIFDTAALANGFNPSGTITFTLYGPNNPTCTGTALMSSSRPVWGNGSYTSAAYVPTVAGTYRWVASYGGDANNNAVTGACDAVGERTVVTARAATNDFDGDGDTDIAIYRPADGTWYVRNIGAFPWGGLAGDVPVPADYDGDGDTDVAIYRPAEGTWYIRNIGAFTFGGLGGDVPVPADYDRDGDADIAIYRPSNGTWYIRNIGAIPWGGSPGDVAVPADYDGDGQVDIAVYRQSTGVWYVRTIGGFAFGSLGDVPVPADYDGDGDADIAIYRPGTGQWFMRDVGLVTWGGTGGDLPEPGNYDGDPPYEQAVYRSGIWYVKDVGAFLWGSPGDIPLNLPFAVRQAFFP